MQDVMFALIAMFLLAGLGACILFLAASALFPRSCEALADKIDEAVLRRITGGDEDDDDEGFTYHPPTTPEGKFIVAISSRETPFLDSLRDRNREDV